MSKCGLYVCRLCSPYVQCIVYVTGYISTTLIAASEVSKCYVVDNENYCFYTDGSVMSWNEAREFCERKNSTLPIITDEHIDNVFQQFINDSYRVTQKRSVWIDAHALPVGNSVPWHWINGQRSGISNAINSK